MRFSEAYRGKAAALDLSVSLCLFFCLWIGPHWPLADSREAIYSAGNLNEPKKGQFHGNWVWSRQHIKKKAGEAVSVFKSSWGSVQWMSDTDTHTHTHWPHTLTNTAAHKRTSCELKLPPDMQTHTVMRSHTHSCTGIWLWVSGWHGGGFKMLDYGNVPELCNLLSSHS